MGVNCLIFAGSEIAATLVKSTGPYRIATQLRNAGYTVQVVDISDNIFFNYKYKLVLKKFVDKDTLWVGFSNTFMSHVLGIHTFSSEEEKQEAYRRNPQLGQDVYDFMSFTKSLNPNVKFVCGGVRTFDIEKYGFYLFKGHTDEQIVEFTDRCARDEEIDKKVIVNREYKDFHKCNIVYQPNDVFNNELVLPIEITRGCIFKCKFCSFPLNGKKKFDYIKDYSILKDEFIRNYEEFGITNYIFSDDTYNDSLEKVKGLYDNVYSQLPFQIRFMTYLRLDLLMRFPDMVKILADSGLLCGTFGIETLCVDNAKIIGKGVDPLKQIEFLHKVKDTTWKNYSIRLDSGFILGLPYDNRKKLEEMRQWFLSDNNPLDFWSINVLSLSNIDTEINQSEFSLNYKNYGYSLKHNKDKRLIWEHKDMDISYEEVYALHDLIIHERETSKKTRYAGFRLEQKLNLFRDLDFILNNNVYEVEKRNPNNILEEEHKKQYFINLMKLDVPKNKK